MRKGFLGSLAVLAAGAGLTFGQSYPPPGPGGLPPGPGGPAPMPGTLPPAGMTTGNPPPGTAPSAYSGPSGANAGYQYAFPDGHPAIMPPGMEGMIPPGAMGMGAPGGAYGDSMGPMGPGMGDMGGPFGSGKGLFGKVFAHDGPPKVWLGAEYLYWVPKSLALNYPLVTTSAPADLGVLGGATTVPLGVNRDDIAFDGGQGFRGWFGIGLEGPLGIEVGGFYLNEQSRQFSYNSTGGGLPVLAVPFFDADANAQGSYVVSFPGINSGAIDMQIRTQALGGELNGVYHMSDYGQDGPGGMALFAGVRYFQLEEEFTFNTRSTTFGVPPGGVVPPGVLPPPTLPTSFFPGSGGVFAGTFFGPALAPYTVATADRVRTYNQFFGGNVGFRGDVGFGKWVVQLTGKFAAGYMRQLVDVDGSSSLQTSTGLTSTVAGGLLNMPQDLGRHRKDRFAILPEGGVTLGYQLTSWFRLTAGYNFLYTNSVIRPTSSLTPVFNRTLIPVSPAYTGNGPATFVPRNVIGDTDFYLHGFTAGVQISF